MVVAAAVLGAGRGGAANPPQVSIVSPASGTATNGAALTVGVAFHAAANVKTLVLLASGREVGRYENPASVKEGTHAFRLDLSGFREGPVTLQVLGYQGAVEAGHAGTSAPTALVVDRTPPL